LSRAALESQDGIAILRINNPPVNALSAETVTDIGNAFDAFERDRSFGGLVIECDGRTFVAGGDIRVFDADDFSLTTHFNALLARIEASDRPVGAALFGTVLGGGLELAMACHIRIARPDTVVGLPEIKLGIIPGSLGTQRLPRLAGLAIAYDMISTGEPVSAEFARNSDIVDSLAEDHVTATRRAVREAAAAGQSLRRTSALRVPDPASLPTVVSKARAAAAARPWLLAYGELERCLTAAATQDFQTGAGVEAESFGRLRPSAQSRAQRHIFFAERAAARGPDSAPARPRKIGEIAALGTGEVVVDLAERARQAGLSVRFGSADGHIPTDADIALLDASWLPDAPLYATGNVFPDAIQLVTAAATEQHRASMTVVETHAAGDAVELTCRRDQRPDAIPTAAAFAKRLGVTAVVTAGGVGRAMQAALHDAVSNLTADGIAPQRIAAVLTAPSGFGNRAGTGVDTSDAGEVISDIITDEEILEKLLAALANRAAFLLEAGQAFRPGDIDVLMVRGYGFANWKGGPVYMADEYGLGRLVGRLDQSGIHAAPLLRTLAGAGARLSGWRRENSALHPLPTAN